MPKNKPVLDAKAWKRIWDKYYKWVDKAQREHWIVIVMWKKRNMQRIVNKELRRLADGKKT